MMRGLASAHGVMVVPPHGVQLGEPVPAFALPWGPPVPAPEQPGTKPKGRPAARAATRAAGNDAAKPAGPVDWSALLG
jgi:molybdopterin molybdotransferase